MFANIGILIFYKYWSFLVENFLNFLGVLHLNTNIQITSFVLPLGLSYYIFQVIGYNIEIYRGAQKAEKNISDFSLFVLFFPKLLVGPIERAKSFLPQLKNKIIFDADNIIEGGKRIAWGLFKKLVVADRISIYQSAIESNPAQQSGITILFATFLYTLQVYADFSGYADIAIGSARLFGFKLMENFNRPLLAKNLSDFWRRWHISLSSWVNDYIFNPTVLKHREWGNWSILYALLISFIIIGIWHGANWNYVLFGILQAIALFYESVSKRARKKFQKKISPVLYNNVSVLLTFLYVSFSMVIFRSDTFGKAMSIMKGIFLNTGTFYYDKPSTVLFILTGSIIMLMYDIQEENKFYRFSLLSNKSWLIQNISYAMLLVYILLAGVFDGGQFIYLAF
jgi:D-alanyl-lipoteichoic acid acyltransferase DltB (MBOAT superfamily)